MWRGVLSYLRALWKHWVALASSVGSLVLSAISAYFRVTLPERAFWIMALVCFFIASFHAWCDARSSLQSCRDELKQLREPKYASELLKIVRDLYEKQDQFTRDLLREIRLRGFMLESQATNLHEKRMKRRQVGILYALQFNTNLICKLSGDQYQINPAMQEALNRVLD
jgi:hypothetical protein